MLLHMGGGGRVGGWETPAPHTPPHSTPALRAAFCMWGALLPMWGETPHTPLVFARPPALFVRAVSHRHTEKRTAFLAQPPSYRNHLASSARKTHPPCLRKARPLATSARKTRSPRLRKDCLWRPLHERRVAFIGGGVGWVGKRPPNGEGGDGRGFLGCGLWRRGAEGLAACAGGGGRV